MRCVPRCLNEAESVLSLQQEPLTPVRKVWEEISKRSKLKGFEVASLSDFSAMLEGDRRFQIVPGQMHVQEDEEGVPDVDVEDSEMGQLGFFAEDCVKLRSKKIIETIINEDEEEVGSIRRMSFVGQTVQSSKLPANKKKETASKKPVTPVKKKKTLRHELKTKTQAGRGKKVKLKPIKRRKT